MISHALQSSRLTTTLLSSSQPTLSAITLSNATMLLGTYYGNQGWAIGYVRALEAWQPI